MSTVPEEKQARIKPRKADRKARLLARLGGGEGRATVTKAVSVGNRHRNRYYLGR